MTATLNGRRLLPQRLVDKYLETRPVERLTVFGVSVEKMSQLELRATVYFLQNRLEEEKKNASATRIAMMHAAFAGARKR